jgi:hypothetical protein
MRLFRRHRDKHRRLDARIADACARHAEASGEAALSQARHDEIQGRIVRPLREAGWRNHFGELIRDSLTEDHRRP